MTAAGPTRVATLACSKPPQFPGPVVGGDEIKTVLTCATETRDKSYSFNLKRGGLAGLQTGDLTSVNTGRNTNHNPNKLASTVCKPANSSTLPPDMKKPDFGPKIPEGEINAASSDGGVQ
jgi:hypothetical protein